jgi:hypothetical protein
MLLQNKNNPRCDVHTLPKKILHKYCTCDYNFWGVGCAFTLNLALWNVMFSRISCWGENAWYGGSFFIDVPFHRSPKKFAKEHGYLFIITYDYNHL